MSNYHNFVVEFDPPKGVTYKKRPLSVWSTNLDRNLHYRTRGALIKAWKNHLRGVMTGWPPGKDPHIPEPVPITVSIKIPFNDRRRRDPHNYCGTVLKVIIDSLVEAGVVPDDTGEWVGHTEPVLYKGKMVVVEVKPRRREDG